MSSSDEASVRPRFAVGDRVRVKEGVRSGVDEGICLDGWTGTVVKVRPRRPVAYLVEWSRAVIESLPSGIEWRDSVEMVSPSAVLYEEDLDPDPGGPPGVLPFVAPPPEIPVHEAPSRPLDWASREDRIRAVFGLSGGDPIPAVRPGTLLAFARYLKATLSFWFEAELASESEKYLNPLLVYSLEDDPPVDTLRGVVCLAEGDGVPLKDLRVCPGSDNYELIEDYSHWFREYGGAGGPGPLREGKGHHGTGRPPPHGA